MILKLRLGFHNLFMILNFYKKVPFWTIHCLLLSILIRFILEVMSHHLDITSQPILLTFNTFKQISEMSFIVSGTFLWWCFIISAFVMDIFQRMIVHSAVSFMTMLSTIFSKSNTKESSIVLVLQFRIQVQLFH